MSSSFMSSSFCDEGYEGNCAHCVAEDCPNRTEDFAPFEPDPDFVETERICNECWRTLPLDAFDDDDDVCISCSNGED